MLTAWAINRVIDPESATQLESWVKTTDIPRLSYISEERWTKDLFLDSLDAICFDDRTTQDLKDLSGKIDGEILTSRSKKKLKWEPKTKFRDLVKLWLIMI